ncbi:YchJ family protein [Shewanella sp. C32]|uniref:YchJ family protein n=1 Tax=Shewanella electrica TaxID=515560 RepID=A0ABT2FQN6_9GAMM|nr:YchJ family protein [Shewanella electrica]MCH1927039.1 YchJ family protein [Shewanella electrica]MCS4558652.1 YchJ family protein [Shewanella electrica]
MSNPLSAAANCPCHSGERYGNCCQPFHIHHHAPTPERLMRSRYSAFVLQLFDYLLLTHAADYRADLTIQALVEATPDQWLGLQVFNSEQQDNNGQVHFCAWFKDGGQIGAIHEVSQFILQHGQWYYTTGEQLPVKLPGRNDPCVCGSGKKFKQCCI